MSVYKVDAEAQRRASETSNDRYSSRTDSFAAIYDLAALRKDQTLPVFKAAHKLSWSECIFQIFFSIQGPIFFYLPSGLRNVGYLPGIGVTILVALFYAYIMNMFLKTEERVRKKFTHRFTEDSNISIRTLINYVFVETSTKRTIAKYLNAYLKYEIILGFSLNVSFNNLFISQNLQIILRYFGYSMSTRMVLIALFPITTLFALVPDLKVMSSIAYFSTGLFISLIFEILYFVCTDPTPLPKVEMIGDMSKLPSFIAVVFLTISCTPVLFQLKQEMKIRKQFGSLFGSLNLALSIVVLLNVCFSIVAYLRFGDKTESNVLQNLPQNTAVVISNIFLTCTLICNNAIMFFVIFETVWCGSFVQFISSSSHKKLCEYFVRTLINLFITVMAIIIPTFSLLIDLASCFSCPFDSLFLPVLLYFLTEWSEAKKNWRLAFVTLESVFFFAIGILFCVMTLNSFVAELISLYSLPHGHLSQNYSNV